MLLAFGSLVVIVAVVLLARGSEVRLTLLGAALLLGLAAGDPLAIMDAFQQGMVAGVVVPITAAMGFAAVLRITGCDTHLVAAMLKPLQRARFLLVPGGILAAYLINVAIPSQTSTAAAVGPILIPLLLAASVPPEYAGAALILGASFGGELLSPAASDLQVVAQSAGVPAAAVHGLVWGPSLGGIVAGTLTFALIYTRSRRRAVSAGASPAAGANSQDEANPMPDRIHPVKAALPLLPIALLILCNPMTNLFPALTERYPGEGLPVLHAMLIGTAVASVVGWRKLQSTIAEFFQGMGFAYANVVSLTITAKCFGAGIALVGISGALIDVLSGRPGLAGAAAVVFPWSLSALSGSGSGPILTFAESVLAHLPPDLEGSRLGALACFGGAFGRTMSPVAAVVIYTATLVGVSPVALVKKIAPPLLVGAVVALAGVLLR